MTMLSPSSRSRARAWASGATGAARVCATVRVASRWATSAVDMVRSRSAIAATLAARRASICCRVGQVDAQRQRGAQRRVAGHDAHDGVEHRLPGHRVHADRQWHGRRRPAPSAACR